MEIGDKSTNSGQWQKLALVLTVLYLSQIYPYVHFHHNHDLKDHLSALDFLSPNHSSGKLPDCQDWHHHNVYTEFVGKDAHQESKCEHEHQHLFFRHIDRYLIRSSVRSLPLTMESSMLQTCSGPKHGVASLSAVFSWENYILPECFQIGSIDSRGPPILS